VFLRRRTRELRAKARDAAFFVLVNPRICLGVFFGNLPTRKPPLNLGPIEYEIAAWQGVAWNQASTRHGDDFSPGQLKPGGDLVRVG
jgi:hypothetical protein